MDCICYEIASLSKPLPFPNPQEVLQCHKSWGFDGVRYMGWGKTRLENVLKLNDMCEINTSCTRGWKRVGRGPTHKRAPLSEHNEHYSLSSHILHM